MFNEESRLVNQLDWGSETHPGLAIRSEARRFLEKQIGQQELPLQFSAAEWWEDFSFGNQYLLEITLGEEALEGEERGRREERKGTPPLPTKWYLRVVDDRRYQLKVSSFMSFLLALAFFILKGLFFHIYPLVLNRFLMIPFLRRRFT